jgi:hypothetical protein
LRATEQQVKEQAQAIANQAQAIADGKIPATALPGQAALILSNATILKAWAGEPRGTLGTPETTKHDWESGDDSPMQTDPNCRICGEHKRSAIHY